MLAYLDLVVVVLLIPCLRDDAIAVAPVVRDVALRVRVRHPHEGAVSAPVQNHGLPTYQQTIHSMKSYSGMKRGTEQLQATGMLTVERVRDDRRLALKNNQTTRQSPSVTSARCPISFCYVLAQGRAAWSAQDG